MKKLFVVLMLGLLPTAVLAAHPSQCALNSTCSFKIRGKFNKELMTSQLEPRTTYVCKVIRGNGSLLSVKNIYASKGVTYNLKGGRLNKPFVVRGPKKGVGFIRYTLYNNNDPWRSNSFQFMCKPEKK